MISVEFSKPGFRLAVLTREISHFEVPLFRACARLEHLEFKVFYMEAIKSERFDYEYQQEIHWGDDLLGGYESQQVADVGALESAVRSWRADVQLIYGYGWVGAPRVIWANWRHGRPQVHRGTLNFHLDPRRPIKGRLLRPMRHWLLRLFHAHHFGGEYSRQVLLDAGVDSAAMFFVPFSVDTAFFLSAAESPDRVAEAARLRAGLGWAEDDHVILFIAQHNWFKGPDIAMEVFRKVAQSNPRARFLVVGSGRMTEKMKDYAKQYLNPGHIHFSGFVPSLKTASYYLASDLVICTSRYETWARMVNEAMLCRRPCVLSRIVPAAGGLVENNENGFVVPTTRAEIFAAAVERFFSLPLSERERMGRKAQSRAKEFDYETHLENVVAAAEYARAHARRPIWLARLR